MALSGVDDQQREKKFQKEKAKRDSIEVRSTPKKRGQTKEDK